MAIRPRQSIRTAACVLAIIGAAAGLGAGAAEDFQVPGHGALRLSVPEGWRVSSKSLAQPASVLLHFKPGTGDAFDVQLTAVWLDKEAQARTTPESVKTGVQRTADQVLPQALEKTAAIEEFREGKGVGYYFTLTDRNPSPGEFKYLTQGSILVGELMTAFTVLTRVPESPEIQQARRMIGAATHASVPSAPPR